MQKNQGSDSRDKPFEQFARQIDIVASRGDVYNQRDLIER